MRAGSPLAGTPEGTALHNSTSIPLRRFGGQPRSLLLERAPIVQGKTSRRFVTVSQASHITILTLTLEALALAIADAAA